MDVEHVDLFTFGLHVATAKDDVHVVCGEVESGAVSVRVLVELSRFIFEEAGGVLWKDSFVVNSKVVVPRPGDSFCILFESGFGRFEA